MRELFHNFVAVHVGEDNFFGDEQFIWNAKIWLESLLKLSLVAERVDLHNCLISMLPKNVKSRPLIHR